MAESKELATVTQGGGIKGMTFDFGNGLTARFITINNEPWFIAKDVADILELANSRDAIIYHVAPENRNTVDFFDGTPGNPNTTIINLAGFISLIDGSEKPRAKAMKNVILKKAVEGMTPRTAPAPALPALPEKVTKEITDLNKRVAALEKKKDAKPRWLAKDFKEFYTTREIAAEVSADFTPADVWNCLEEQGVVAPSVEYARVVYRPIGVYRYMDLFTMTRRTYDNTGAITLSAKEKIIDKFSPKSLDILVPLLKAWARKRHIEESDFEDYEWGE